MGKCSGLKGGGHHRRALDVAAKKQSEKAARKKEQAEAGKRALILKEILTKIDKDCDLYLDAAVCERFDPHNNNKTTTAAAAAANPELCRKHFRHEACTNKRCRFSKEYSIAEALSNVMSGTNTNSAFDDYNNNKNNNKNNNDHNNDNNDNVKNTMTIPALRYLPGILGDHHYGSKAKKNRRILRRQRPKTNDDDDDDDDDDDAVGDHLPPPPSPPFEKALSEGSSAVDRIVSCLDSDRDVVSFGTTCWHLYDQILRDQGCPDVQLRRYRSNHRKLDRRNKTLLSNKALGGSLRYAVGYFETSTFHNNNNNNNNNSSKKNKQKSKKKNNSSNNSNKPRLRPVLIFDYENPNVYKAFVESGVRKSYRRLGAGGDAGLELESALEKNCKLSE